MPPEQDVPALLRAAEAHAANCMVLDRDYTAELLCALAALVNVQRAEIKRLREAGAAMLEKYGPPVSVDHLCDYPEWHPITAMRAALREGGTP